MSERKVIDPILIGDYYRGLLLNPNPCKKCNSKIIYVGVIDNKHKFCYCIACNNHNTFEQWNEQNLEQLNLDYSCCGMHGGNEYDNAFRIIVGHYPRCQKLKGIVDISNLKEKVDSLFVKTDKKISDLEGKNQILTTLLTGKINELENTVNYLQNRLSEEVQKNIRFINKNS